MNRGRIALLLFALVLLVGGVLVGCVGPAKGTAEWHADQGYKLAEEGRYDEAIEECNKAIELDPNLAMAYNNRAWAYNEKGQWDLAIADCNKTIELDPNLAMAYGNRALAYKQQGKKAEAIADFEKFITLTDNPQWIEMARQEIEELSR